MRVLGVVTARGGSKGIPRKNIAPLLGRPLLAYTADAALAARRLTRVILSTDDAEIAGAGRACGLEVPFLRPAELAADDTPSLPVVQHALVWFEERDERFDAVCLLQPTNPLRKPETIDACIALFEREAADAVVTILPVPYHYNPYWVYFRSEDGSLRVSAGEDDAPPPRRQDLPAAFHREGSVYVTRRDVVMEGNSLYGRRLLGYPVDASASVNIDCPEDLERAARLLRARGALFETA